LKTILAENNQYGERGDTAVCTRKLNKIWETLTESQKDNRLNGFFGKVFLKLKAPKLSS
jgi:hypothetical protein